jgi:hypothetical protein
MSRAHPMHPAVNRRLRFVPLTCIYLATPERAPRGAEKGRARMRTKRQRPDFLRLMARLPSRGRNQKSKSE